MSLKTEFRLAVAISSLVAISASASDNRQFAAHEVPASAIEPSNGLEPHAKNEREATSSSDSSLSPLTPSTGESIAQNAALAMWQAKSATHTLIGGRYSRCELNDAFKVERNYVGTFRIETPCRWRIDERPVEVKKGAVSKNRSKDGHPYYVESGGTPETWIFTGEEMIWIDVQAKSYQRVEIPKEKQHTEAARCPLPALFFFDANETKRRFALTCERETDKTLLVSAIPTEPPKRLGFFMVDPDCMFPMFNVGNCDRAKFLLDKTLAQPAKVALMYESTKAIYTVEKIVFRQLDRRQDVGIDSVEPVFNEEMLQGYRRIVTP